MKKIFLFAIFFGIINFVAKSQTDDSGVKLDLLKAPSSPASNLLGIAASDVDKPTDVSAFMLSLQKASNNFTSLPSNYAVDIAPHWLFKKNNGDVSTKGLSNTTGKGVFCQTLVFSFAIRNTDSTEKTLTPNTTYGGFGFKFSIVRGKYDRATTQALFNIRAIQIEKTKKLEKSQRLIEAKNEMVALRDSLKKTLDDAKKQGKDIKKIMHSPEYLAIDSALQSKTQISQDAKAVEDNQGQYNEKIRAIASTFQTARVGWTWDIAGGLSGEFINKRFDNSKMHNAGIWTTIGYTDEKFEKFGTGLILIRLLYNPDQIFAKDNQPNDIGNITTLDFGGRYVYSKPQSKFSASVEAIRRSVLSSNTIKPSWRFILNADYSIWQNQKLTFSFGRNFDGTITKDGNLVAALTFLTGFGNKR